MARPLFQLFSRRHLSSRAPLGGGLPDGHVQTHAAAESLLFQLSAFRLSASSSVASAAAAAAGHATSEASEAATATTEAPAKASADPRSSSAPEAAASGVVANVGVGHANELVGRVFMYLSG